VYLNKKKPLSEPKWCRTNQADDWLLEQFGSWKSASIDGWKGKLEVADPDPVGILCIS
jgi:20S proteasome subunit alpha 6